MHLQHFNKFFKIKVDGKFVGISGLYRAVGLRNTEELCRRAMLSRCDVYEPKRLTCKHFIEFISI